VIRVAEGEQHLPRRERLDDLGATARDDEVVRLEPLAMSERGPAGSGHAAEQPGSLEKIAARRGRGVELARHGEFLHEVGGETGGPCTPAYDAVPIAHWPKHIDTKGVLGYSPSVESAIPSPSTDW